MTRRQDDPRIGRVEALEAIKLEGAEKTPPDFSRFASMRDHKGRERFFAEPTHIKRRVAVFQPRVLRVNGYLEDTQAEDLKEALGSGRDVDPIIVWWSGKHWYCVDGHHRLAAFLAWNQEVRKGKAKGVTRRIEVVPFAGSLDEVIAEAVKLNAQIKLPLTKEEQRDAAWRYLVLSRAKHTEEVLSLRTINKLYPVAWGTLRKMSKALDHLTTSERVNLADPEAVERIAGTSWRKIAAGIARNSTVPEDELDAKRVAFHDDQFTKATSKTRPGYFNDPVNVLEFVSRCGGDMPTRLLRELGVEPRGDTEGDDWSEEDLTEDLDL